MNEHQLCGLCIVAGLGIGFVVSFIISAIVVFAFGLKEVWGAPATDGEISLDLGRIE